MARLPVIALVGGRSPRERAWAAIRAQRKPEWTAQDILIGTEQQDIPGVDPASLKTYLLSLTAAGIIAVTRRIQTGAQGVIKWYRLVRDEGVDAPRVRRDGSRVTKGIKQEQMWRTLRILNTDVNAIELAAHASSSVATVVVRQVSLVSLFAVTLSVWKKIMSIF